MSEGVFEGKSDVHAPPADQSEFEDKSILCIDCSTHFIWTSGEQVFYRDKQLQNPPKRCKECSGVKQRIEVAVNCARCGQSTTVPFYPSQGRPVYCRSCFLEMNPSLLAGNGTV
jgi:CxxC-x17-CxxC domain-containing protein